MSYRLQAKGSLEFPDVDPGDTVALDKYFHEGEDQFKQFYKGLAGRPNARFFAARMTFLNKLSDHASGPRMVLSPKGANVRSLVGKPVHFTEDFEGHWASKGEGRKIQTFGVTLGGRLHDPQEDGAIPLDVFGLLWDDDHPEQVQAVASSQGDMGMSWEIKAPASALRRLKHPSMEQPILLVDKCDFSGTAILKRGSAAYPDSHMLFAGADGNEIDLDLESIPEVDPQHLESSASNSTNSVVTVRYGPPRKKEKPMGDFCSDCKSRYQALLKSGEILTKVELESQREYQDLVAAKEVAENAAKEALEAKAAAEKEAQDLKAQRARDEKENAAETEAIKAWEAARDTFKKGKDGKDDPETRKTFLQAQKQIFLGESVESVKTAFETLRALEAEKKATDEEKRSSKFNAFDPGVQRWGDEITDEQANRSSRIIAEKFNEEKLRAFMRGEGYHPHLASTPGAPKEG